jgi:hypothetical protein
MQLQSTYPKFCGTLEIQRQLRESASAVLPILFGDAKPVLQSGIKNRGFIFKLLSQSSRAGFNPTLQNFVNANSYHW